MKPTANAPVHVILNARSGTAAGVTAAALAEMFATQGLDVVVDDDQESELRARGERALASGAELVVAAGGDGTVTALAEVLAGTGRTLAILPLGTVNLLARDLGMPLVVQDVIAGLKHYRPRHIDVGEVNGRFFLHKVVIGLLPGMVAGRERVRGRGGLAAQLGFWRFLLRRLLRARRIALAIAPAGSEVRARRVQALAVASNAYDEGLGRFFSRRSLESGRLTLYLVKHLGIGDALRLAAEMLAGRWQEDEALEVESVEAVTIHAKKPSLKAMLDGELVALTPPLVFGIRPGALAVLAPVPADAPGGGSAAVIEEAE